MALFFIGILEMIIVTAWTKTVTKTQVIASSMVTMINVLIWYYVLQTIVDDISNWQLIVLYALGCAIGTAITMVYFQKSESASRRRESAAALNTETNS